MKATVLFNITEGKQGNACVMKCNKLLNIYKVIYINPQGLKIINNIHNTSVSASHRSVKPIFIDYLLVNQTRNIWITYGVRV